MRPRADRPAGVVQKQREIKNKRIRAVSRKGRYDQLRILVSCQRIELVDADQRVFVRGVAMEKFMLHQAGELAELRNVTAEEIDPMHHPQGAADFALARNDPAKNLARLFRVAQKSAVINPDFAGEQIGKIRAELEVAFLRNFEHFHHLDRFLFEKIGRSGKQLAVLQ